MSPSIAVPQKMWKGLNHTTQGTRVATRLCHEASPHHRDAALQSGLKDLLEIHTGMEYTHSPPQGWTNNTETHTHTIHKV